MNIIRHCLPVLAAIITTCNDQDTIVDAAWALSYLSDGDNDRIQEVVNLNLVPAFENMLKPHASLAPAGWDQPGWA